jgi:hypothetical protein
MAKPKVPAPGQGEMTAALMPPPKLPAPGPTPPPATARMGAPSLLEYLPLPLGTEQWRVEKFELFAVELLPSDAADCLASGR